MKTPYLLIAFRFLLAPTILIFSYYTEESIARLWIIVFIILGLLSDVFDGIIARQMGISTVKMRRIDSQTDLVFWLSIGIACYHLNPELIKVYRYEVIAIFIMEGLCYTISFLKFGKETCTHAFLSKLWGLCLLTAFISLIGFGHGGFPLQLAIYWGLFSQLDVILILLLLPKWQNDIPSTYHAYLIRRVNGLIAKYSSLIKNKVTLLILILHQK